MNAKTKIRKLQVELSTLRRRAKHQPVAGIGGRIQKFREAIPLGLVALARRAKVSSGTLSKIESTKNSNPRLRTILDIAKALKIDAEALVTGL